MHLRGASISRLRWGTRTASKRRIHGIVPPRHVPIFSYQAFSDRTVFLISNQRNNNNNKKDKPSDSVELLCWRVVLDKTRTVEESRVKSSNVLFDESASRHVCLFFCDTAAKLAPRRRRCWSPSCCMATKWRQTRRFRVSKLSIEAFPKRFSC